MKTEKSILPLPDKPGFWHVKDPRGIWWPAEVKQTETWLQAQLIGTKRWHDVEWMEANNWKEWRLVAEKDLSRS